jgi:hypothetical protein
MARRSTTRTSIIGPTGPVDVDRGTLDLLTQVAQDAANLISCNCSYAPDTPIERRCDGSCTHGMAIEALRQLAAAMGKPHACSACGWRGELTGTRTDCPVCGRRLRELEAHDAKEANAQRIMGGALLAGGRAAAAGKGKRR